MSGWQHRPSTVGDLAWQVRHEVAPLNVGEAADQHVDARPTNAPGAPALFEVKPRSGDHVARSALASFVWPVVHRSYQPIASNIAGSDSITREATQGNAATEATTVAAIAARVTARS